MIQIILDPKPKINSVINVCHPREMRAHFQVSGHKSTGAVVCECGRIFHGGTCGGYRYHR